MKAALTILLLISIVPIYAQKANVSLPIKKAQNEIQLDGILDESDWRNAAAAQNFHQQFPFDSSFAISKTEVKLTYDDNFIYVGAICYNSSESDYIIQSLKRDFNFRINDAFAIYLDPYGDQTNGFCFAINPLGVQLEGLIQGGGNRGTANTWDNKWFSKVMRGKDKWIVEMAIPFRTIRYNEGSMNWGINFARNDLNQNETSCWAPVPRNFNVATMAFNGDLLWDAPPKKAGLNVAFIPYGITGYTADYENDTSLFRLNAGFDAKLAVTSSLNLDITVNPDFSQVEVDAQQTNLTRFNLFFPEKRQFFIENSDLFGRFGFSKIRPFFSRRVGLNNGLPVPIIAGLRLSGKLNEDWRIGVMNMQTGQKEFISSSDTTIASPQNFTVAAVQRKVFQRSAIGAIIVNRQTFQPDTFSLHQYNRIIGLDYNLASADNKWMGKFFYHKSLFPNQTNYSSANASWLMYSTRSWNIHWNHEYVGKNYNAASGFVQRANRTYWRLEPSVRYKFYPKAGPINNHGPKLYYNLYTDSAYQVTDMLIQPSYEIKFQNTSTLKFEINALTTRLLFDTDITFSGNTKLPAGLYNYQNGLISYNSDQRKKINGNISLNYGSYYIGSKFTLNGNINLRTNPWGIFSLKMSYNDIRMPEQYESATILLVGPKFEFSFTKSLFWSTFIQYNSQAENFNINSRLQWRFKPMSDLYIVYTDNYYTLTETTYFDRYTTISPNLKGPRNRALVIKLVYWLAN